MEVLVLITENITRVIVLMVILVKTVNHWLTGVMVVVVCHNHVKMEQHVNKFKTFISVYANLVGQVKCVM